MMPNAQDISTLIIGFPALALLLIAIGMTWLLVSHRSQERWRRAACCLEQISLLLRQAQETLLLEIDRESRLLHETSDRNSALNQVREKIDAAAPSTTDADQSFREFVRWQNNERNLTQLTWQTLVSQLMAAQHAWELIDEPTHRTMADTLMTSTRARMVGALQGSNMQAAYLKAIDRHTAEVFFDWLRWPDPEPQPAYPIAELDQMERSLILSAYGRGWYEVVEGRDAPS